MFNNQERRGNKRTAKPITASFRIRSDEARETETNDWFSVNLINLSTGDAFFIYKKGLGIGTILDLKIDVPESILTINCVGKVTRIEQYQSNSMFCTSIRFIDIGKQEEAIINANVAEDLEQANKTSVA